MPRARKTVAAVSLLAVGAAAPAARTADPYAALAPVPALSSTTLDTRYQAADRDIGRARQRQNTSTTRTGHKRCKRS